MNEIRRRREDWMLETDRMKFGEHRSSNLLCLLRQRVEFAKNIDEAELSEGRL